MKIAAISGSLRAASYNSQLLNLVGEIVTEQGHDFEICGIGHLPLYNQDLDNDDKPEVVSDLIQSIAQADGLIIATPEYNYSIPGGLKNALDWASRPAYKSCLAQKKVAIVSAANGPLGGARAQVHLRDILAGTLTYVYRAPDFLLASAGTAFTPDGAFDDPTMQSKLERFVTGYLSWLNE